MLKAFATAAAMAILLAGRPARADTLVTGAIRDRTGAAVSGARVTAFDSEGRALGTDVAIADGTFAVAAAAPAESIAISCDYCRPVRVPVAPGEPAVVIVERFAALTTRGPSPADIRALPYRAASDIASLEPFTVIESGVISDRALDFESALTVNGLPFYNPADGSTAANLIPAHALTALDVAPPLIAPLYGGYAAAGVYDLRLRDPDGGTSRFDAGGASDAVVRVQASAAGAGYAASSDAGENRQAASADANFPLGGGRISLDALDLVDSASHASGGGLAFATDSRRYATSAAVTATQTGTSSFVTASAAVHNRGPLALEFGARANRATSAAPGAAGAQFDAAIYVRATRSTSWGRLSAALAWDRGSDSSSAGSTRGGALVGSLARDTELGPRWSAHSGVVSNLRIPTFAELPSAAPVGSPSDRTLLFEQGLTYTDLRRLRVSGSAYTERSTGAAFGHVNGIGTEGAWQIAPRLSLRAWLLRANQSSVPATLYPTGPYYSPDAERAASPTRQLIWLSYEKDLRIDALVRGGALEADVRIPVGAVYALTIGSARYDGRRITTFGLMRR